MRMVFCILACILFCGCTWPTQKEIDYHGQVPVESNHALAMQFASQLASQTGLTITSTILQSNLKPGAYSLVFMCTEPGSKPEVGVVITTRVPDNTLFISVTGDIQSSKAVDVSQKAVDLFKNQFPGSTLTPFTRRSGPAKGSNHNFSIGRAGFGPERDRCHAS